mgnify:CR=1 FL=1
MSGPEDMVIEIRVSGGELRPFRLILRHDTVALECTNEPPDVESGKAILTGLANVVYDRLTTFAETYAVAEVVELVAAESQTIQ